MPKRLALFFDGTWKRADDGERASNVVRLMRRVASEGGGMDQVVYYDRGVGSRRGMDRLLGGGLGHGLADNVLDGYVFLGNNWEPGDEIHIFGFSRGAYTARSLAGVLGAVGLLGRETLGLLPDAWRLYRTPPTKRPDVALPARQVDIHCLGVWDTVGSLGIPGRLFRRARRRRHGFHDTQLGSRVRCALHAVAIDERRRPFQPTLWTGEHDGIVEQVWFPGVHSDLGGGYDDRGLADLSLEWMAQRVLAHTGLRLHGDKSPDHRPDPMGLLHDSLGWYRVLGQHLRQLPSGTFLHAGALERYGSVAPAQVGGKVRARRYGPVNLQAAVGRLRPAPATDEVVPRQGAPGPR